MLVINPKVGRGDGGDSIAVTSSVRRSGWGPDIDPAYGQVKNLWYKRIVYFIPQYTKEGHCYCRYIIVSAGSGQDEAATSHTLLGLERIT